MHCNQQPTQTIDTNSTRMYSNMHVMIICMIIIMFIFLSILYITFTNYMLSII